MTATGASSSSGKQSRRKLILAIVAIVVIAILVVPIILGGGFTVPVSKVIFDETTGSLSASGTAQTSLQTMTVFEYYFSLRTGGMVRTSDTSVDSSRGTANITLSMMLTNPSNQTIDLGKTTITGGIGTRTHTLYLSVDQGVRAPGSYKLNVTITANVKPALLPLEVGLTAYVITTWQIS